MAQPTNLMVLWVNHRKPCRRRTTSTTSFKPQVFRFHRTDRLLDLALFLDLATMSPRLDDGFEAKPPNRTRLRLALLALCDPHLTLSTTGSLEPSLLVPHSWRPRKAKTFHTCSSPAPTQIKSQPALAILRQESVHTTLSITHHLRATIHWSSDTPSPQGRS